MAMEQEPMDNPAPERAEPLPPIAPDGPAGWALFLDVDGTLVEIAADPEAVVVPSKARAVLAALRGVLDGAIALVSGRTVEKLDELFAPLRLPAAGNHGLERRGADGRLIRPAERRAELDRVRAPFLRFAADHPGVIVEDKGLSVALHFRRAPGVEPEALHLAERLVAEIDSGFRVQRGKKMIEIRPHGGDKGSVAVAFMAEPPFAGRTPLFIGDDVTDEDGFAAVNAMGGLSVRVGGNEPTVARFRVANVAALLDWLERLADASAQPK
jgi:trehalose 6-phosphate phosphatase